MTIAMKQGSVITEIGPGSLLHSLFSTIAVRLEGGKWGSRFPFVLNKLYQGKLAQGDAMTAIAEMTQIRKLLAEVAPSQVVWDIDHLEQAPPWGDSVGGHVKNMANYYVTTTGRNLVDEIIDNLESLRDFGGSLEIISFDDRLPL